VGTNILQHHHFDNQPKVRECATWFSSPLQACLLVHLFPPGTAAHSLCVSVCRWSSICYALHSTTHTV